MMFPGVIYYGAVQVMLKQKQCTFVVVRVADWGQIVFPGFLEIHYYTRLKRSNSFI